LTATGLKGKVEDAAQYTAAKFFIQSAQAEVGANFAGRAGRTD